MVKIVISIREKHWKNIISGEKTLELRKSFPSKNYFTGHELHVKNPLVIWNCQNILCYVWVPELKCIAGTFITNRFDYYFFDKFNPIKKSKELMEKSCVEEEFIKEYSKNGKDILYAWHISNVKETTDKLCNLNLSFGIKNPPQSWCYVKEIN